MHQGDEHDERDEVRVLRGQSEGSAEIDDSGSGGSEGGGRGEAVTEPHQGRRQRSEVGIQRRVGWVERQFSLLPADDWRVKVADKIHAGEPLTDLELNSMVMEVGQSVVRDCAEALADDDPRARAKALKKLIEVRRSRNEVARSIKLFRGQFSPKQMLEEQRGTASTKDFITLPKARHAQ